MAKILCIGAHVDDLEFGMGGTLNKLTKNKENVFEIYVCSDAGTMPENKDFDLTQECIESMRVYGLGCKIAKFQTNYFRRDFQEIRDSVYKYRDEFKPDIVFCTSPLAAHPDHQVIGESCLSIFQECSIFCVEDVRGNQRQLVNKWIRLGKEDIDKKLEALGCYKSQMKRAYMNFSKIISLARARGLQIDTEFAEGFEVLRDIT